MFLITAVDFLFKTIQNMIFLQAVTLCERVRMYKLKKEKKKTTFFERKKHNRYMNTLCEFAVRLK